MAEAEANKAKTRAAFVAANAAAGIERQLGAAMAPVLLLGAVVKYQSQYKDARSLFNGLAPVLFEQVPPKTVTFLDLAPSGVVRDVYPKDPRAVGLDLLNATIYGRPQSSFRYLEAVQERSATLNGPFFPAIGGPRAVLLTVPIFISGVEPNETFGRPDAVNAFCGRPCEYNATTRSQFWGFADALLNLDMLLADKTSPLTALDDNNFHYLLEAPRSPIRTVASVGELGRDPVKASVKLLDDHWYIYVSPHGGWRVDWFSGLVAAVVVGAVIIAVLLLVALISWRQHQLLLETLLPKQVIADLQASGIDRKGMRVYSAATPADLLLALLGRLLEGAPPDPRDVVLLRTALLRNVDVYAPLNLRGDIKDANLDADVMLALMRQLGATGGTDQPNLSRTSNLSLAWSPAGLGTDSETGGALTARQSRRHTVQGLLSSTSQIGAGHTQPATFETISGALAYLLGPEDAPPHPAHGASSMLPMAPSAFTEANGTTTPAHLLNTNAGGAAVSFPELREMLRTHDGVGAGSGHIPTDITGVALSMVFDSSREPSGRLLAPLSSAVAAARREHSLRDGGPLGRCSSGSLATGAPEVPVPSKRRKSLLLSTMDRLTGGNSRGGMASPLGAPPASLSAAPTGGQLARQPSKLRGLPPPVLQAPPAPVIDEVERLLAGAEGSWQYDTWRLDEASGGHALSALGFYLIQRQGLLAHFKIQPLKLARLLRAVESGYGSNPYHNSVHAADVLQTLHMLLHGAQMTAHYVDRLGLLAAYLAAIIHDHGHPGLTNDFLIATSDPLAIRYNDRSPLESHHAASAFALLQRPDLDALAGLAKAERAALRKQVVEMVLATDMKQHFAILGQFNTMHRLTSYTAGTNPLLPMPRPSGEKGASGRTESVEEALHGSATPSSPAAAAAAAPRPRDDDNGSELLLSLQIALKVADIGHLGEELSVHQRWLAALEEEFFAQGDRERQLGLPISPLFDRAKQGVSKSQVGFYDFVALPLAHAMSAAFPGAQPLLRCFVANYNHWRGVEGKPAV